MHTEADRSDERSFRPRFSATQLATVEVAPSTRGALLKNDWLSVRKEALVSLADGALNARTASPAPSALTDPGLVLVRSGLPGSLGR